MQYELPDRSPKILLFAVLALSVSRENRSSRIVIRIPATQYGPEHYRAWYVDGDLIYALAEELKFKEYFRRVGAK